jgi:hypothetical protein
MLVHCCPARGAHAADKLPETYWIAATPAPARSEGPHRLEFDEQMRFRLEHQRIFLSQGPREDRSRPVPGTIAHCWTARRGGTSERSLRFRDPKYMAVPGLSLTLPPSWRGLCAAEETRGNSPPCVSGPWSHRGTAPVPRGTVLGRRRCAAAAL